MEINPDDILKMKSPIDSIILDLIIDHFNMQSLKGKKELLSGKDFQSICDIAESIYIKETIFDDQAGIA